MTKIIADITVSLDGFVAGPEQSLDNPLGKRGELLHYWMFRDAEQNKPEIKLLGSHEAYIMGRNMFGPGRGEWDLDWKGWWGGEPPYHAPVFVLTHHRRESLQLQGTRITFVNDGINSALDQARHAVKDGSIGIAGGASTVRQYILAGLVDELRLHISPVMLGSGEYLWEGLEHINFEQIAGRSTKLVTHISYRILN